MLVIGLKLKVHLVHTSSWQGATTHWPQLALHKAVPQGAWVIQLVKRLISAQVMIPES